MNRIGICFVLVIVGLLASSSRSYAGLTFYPGDPVGWSMAVANAGYTVEPFNTVSENIALSNEVELPPPVDSGLGTPILTFDKLNTGLSGSFTFASQDIDQFLLYRISPIADLFLFDRPDAIEMKVIDGSLVYALALEIVNLMAETATVEVFSGETLLESTSDLAVAPDSFLGILSDQPFSRITYSGTDNGIEGFSDFQFAFVPAAGSIPGDFDHDDTVDGVDLPIWATAFGVNIEADADQDNDTDGNDFLIWQQNFGLSLGMPMVVSVPEPTSIWLVALGLVGIGRGRRYA